MIELIKTITYVPLYNIFVFILNIPYIDVGLATIILTIFVKIVIFPLSKKATLAQIKMKSKESEISDIKNKYTNTEEQALKIMEFYKTNNINPFSSILILIIQIPIIYSLYYIFFRSGLPVIDTNIIYSFVKIPAEINMNLLGVFDVSKSSIVFALLASITTFLQMHIQGNISKNEDKNNQNKEDFSQTLTKQMKYTMPIVVFFISWKIAAIVSLYWVVSNIAGIIQDIYIKKTLLRNT